MASEDGKQRGWRSWLESASSIAVVVGVGLVAWKIFAVQGTPAQPQKPPPTETIAIGESWTKGSISAQVAVVEYSEFQCPFCGVFARDVFPTLEKKYISTGKVLLVFRHLPLSIHQFATGAAQASECAGSGQKFWQMHDLLFRDQSHLDVTSLLERGEQLGLPRDQFTTCLNGAANERIKADMKEASSLGVTGTPSFFVGRIQSDGRIKATDRLSGAQPGLLDAAIDKLLRE